MLGYPDNAWEPENIVFGNLEFIGHHWRLMLLFGYDGSRFLHFVTDVFPLTDQPAPTKWFTVYILGACVFIY
jgi:hypothetical protein